VLFVLFRVERDHSLITGERGTVPENTQGGVGCDSFCFR